MSNEVNSEKLENVTMYRAGAAPGKIDREKDIDAAVDWMFTGKVGTSSRAICAAFLAKKCRDSSTPSDPDDLRRCRLFLSRLSSAGASTALRRIAAQDAQWVPLVREWDSLCILMDEEAPEWRNGVGSAPKTYHRMKLLEVEGLRIKYPDGEVKTYDDGTLSSFTNRSRSVVTLNGGKIRMEHGS